MPVEPHNVSLDEADRTLEWLYPAENQGAHLPIIYFWARGARADIMVELGAYWGYSTLALQKAARLNGGHLWTIEIDPTRAGVRGFDRAPDVAHGTLLLGDSGELGRAWDRGPIDLLYIDGDHSPAGVVRDWEAWSPHVAEHGVVFFHDTLLPARSPNGGPGILLEILAASEAWAVVNMPVERGLGIVMRRRSAT